MDCNLDTRTIRTLPSSQPSDYVGDVCFVPCCHQEKGSNIYHDDEDGNILPESLKALPIETLRFQDVEFVTSEEIKVDDILPSWSNTLTLVYLDFTTFDGGLSDTLLQRMTSYFSLKI